MTMTPEAKKIVKALKQHPHAHIHYFDNMMWSMYTDKKTFEKYWMNGDGDSDLSEIEIMEGNDFDSSYLPPLVEALLHIQGGSGSSI